MLTKVQILELRRETFAAYERGELEIDGVRVREQLQVETAALDPQGGVLGLNGCHARRISQADALARCAEVYTRRHRKVA
jgi:hypothetical protein